MNGFVVGCGEPPSGSTVTATTAPDGICLLSLTTVVPAPPPNVPAGEAALARDDPRLVRLARRGAVETGDDERAGAARADDHRAGGTGERHPRRALVWSFSCRCRETFQTPRPITAHAATAAAAASGAAQRGRSGTTFGRSARAASRIRDAELRRRRDRLDRIRERAGGQGQLGDLLLAAPAAREVLLEDLPLGSVEGVERVGAPSGRGSVPCPSLFLVGRVEQLAQPREPGEHAALDRSQRLAEPFCELRLGEASIVGELDRLTLLIGEPASAACTRSRSSRSHAASSADGSRPPSSPSGSGSARRRSSRRTRSTARRWTSVRIHVLAFARSGTNRDAPRQMARNASCTASSASASSRITRSASP